MTIKIELDTQAVRKLIDEDATFELELRQATIREVVRRMLPRDPGKLQLDLINAAVTEAKTSLLDALGTEGRTYDKVLEEKVDLYVTRIRQASYGKTLPATSQERLKIGDAIGKSLDTLFDEELRARLGSVTDNVEKALQAHLDRYGINEKIAARMDRRFDELVELAVDARIARIFEAAKS